MITLRDAAALQKEAQRIGRLFFVGDLLEKGGGYGIIKRKAD